MPAAALVREIHAGVMSGTSLDGVDAVVADFAPGGSTVCRLLGAAHISFPGIGHVRSAGKGYDWIPANYSAW